MARWIPLGLRRLGSVRRRRVWLASYPRSGNTLLRCLLNYCFGLPSTSIYGPGDLGWNSALERHAGHYVNGSTPPTLTLDKPALVKTHLLPSDSRPAIYVVRDGRAATVSFWEFRQRRSPLRDIIAGTPPFGTWANHVAAWQPWERPHTLLLRYEDMLADRHEVIERLGAFLNLPILSRILPDREELAPVGGRWIRHYSDWRCQIGVEDLELFDALNGHMMAKLGYEHSLGTGA